MQEVAKSMCGKIMVCPETGEQGFLCRNVYITEEIDMHKELYVGIMLDRNKSCPVIVYGSWSDFPYTGNSGTNNEMNHHNGQLQRNPKFLENFRKIYIDIAQGLNVSMLSEVANELGIADKKSEIIFLLKHLYDCFIQRDAELIELNPLVYTSE